MIDSLTSSQNTNFSVSQWEKYADLSDRIKNEGKTGKKGLQLGKLDETYPDARIKLTCSQTHKAFITEIIQDPEYCYLDSGLVAQEISLSFD